jgi:hypothetical protein
MRVIIRPEKIHITPRLLAIQAKCRVASYHDMIEESPDWEKDFFMYYPPTDVVENAPDDYQYLRRFYVQNKASQRLDIIKAGLKGIDVAVGPNTAQYLPKAEKFVVRPLSHEKGAGYRVTDSSVDFKEGEEYISPLFPKTHEYRVIFVKGKLTVLQKKQPDGRGPDDCWSNTQFTVIENVDRSYLNMNTDVLTKLEECNIIAWSHIVGVDVLYHHPTRDYRITEFNTCPCLSDNRAVIGQKIRSAVLKNAE